MKKRGPFDLSSSAGLRRKVNPAILEEFTEFTPPKSTPREQNYLNKAPSHKRYGPSIMAS